MFGQILLANILRLLLYFLFLNPEYLRSKLQGYQPQTEKGQVSKKNKHFNKKLKYFYIKYYIQRQILRAQFKCL